MRCRLKPAIAILTCACLFSLAGCAAAPVKDELSAKDAVIQNLTGENAALRGEINRIAGENDGLLKENLKLRESLRALEEEIRSKKELEKRTETIK